MYYVVDRIQAKFKKIAPPAIAIEEE
jgi:hypothetical protein